MSSTNKYHLSLYVLQNKRFMNDIQWLLFAMGLEINRKRKKKQALLGKRHNDLVTFMYTRLYQNTHPTSMISVSIVRWVLTFNQCELSQDVQKIIETQISIKIMSHYNPSCIPTNWPLFLLHIHFFPFHPILVFIPFHSYAFCGYFWMKWINLVFHSFSLCVFSSCFHRISLMTSHCFCTFVPIIVNRINPHLDS